MSVDALQLKPRSPVALFDAALRLCATTSGVWAATLPAGAVLVACAFFLADAVQHGKPLALPVAAVTGAWCLRALSQGAACLLLEQAILGQGEPSVRSAYFAALKRAPSLVTGAALFAWLNAALVAFTLGIGLFFAAAHLCGYAVLMRGQGSALGVYGHAARLLGPARQSAGWLRVFGIVQLVLAANLNLATSLVLLAGSHLFGFDLTFLERFTSIDNGVWVVTVGALTFALFEPVRAATATLLLIDGRVRQEGVDLLTAVEQLPRRARSKAAFLAASTLLLLGMPSFASEVASAELATRVEELAEACEWPARPELGLGPSASPAHVEAVGRFVARLERLAYDDEDCVATQRALDEGLALLREAEPDPSAGDPRAAAKAILARPEFSSATPRPKEEDAPLEDESWLGRALRELFERFWRWLLKREPRDVPDRPAPDVDSSLPGANVVIVASVALAAAILIYAMWQLRRRPDAEAEALDAAGGGSTPLTVDPSNALSKAPESWAGLADDLAARGQLREAVRHLYLALLSRLHRDGAIDYEPTASNWDYLRHFRGPRERKPSFRELTIGFDFAWYGQVPLSGDAWLRFRALAEPFLTAAPGAPRA